MKFGEKCIYLTLKSVRDKNVFMESLKYLYIPLLVPVCILTMRQCPVTQYTLNDILLKLKLLLGHSISLRAAYDTYLHKI
jgi:hypothetical protein